MLFKQVYTYREDLFGQQTVWFAVSDSYDELFSTEGTDTDIFQLESVKQDLNTDEGSFAIDELTFSINQLACNSDNAQNALYFALESKDINKLRFCALFILRPNETPNNTNLLFLGRINDKISGDDKLWKAGSYATLINPIREYKFSALSLDISVLEDCLFTSKVYNTQEVLINNIYERLSSEDINTILLEKKCSYLAFAYGWDHVVANMELTNSIKLENCIDLYLQKANELISDKYGLNIKFNLLSSDLGIQVAPAKYETASPDGQEDWQVEGVTLGNSPLYNLKLKPDASDSLARSPYINWKMIDPKYGQPDIQETDYSDSASNIRKQISGETPYSFKSLKNVSELLFAIAKSFNCYLTSNYTVDNDGILNVNFSFVSRQKLTEGNKSYFISANDANIDTSSAISNDDNRYYSVPNKFMTDGVDQMKVITEQEKIDGEWQAIKLNSYDSENRENLDKSIAYDEEKYNLKFQKTLLSTSVSIIKTDGHIQAINVTTGNLEFNKVKEILTNALYIITPILETRQQSIINRFSLGITEFIRPIAKVFAKIDGVILSDKFGEGVTLGAYINAAFGHEKQYYETEYSITVPYWNGFSALSNGTDCNWNKIKLGSNIELNEDIRAYINSEWVVFRPAEGVNFSVVSIERSLSKPETKIKLQNVSRFSYQNYFENKNGEVLESSGTTIHFELSPKIVNGEYTQYTVASSQTITAGDAVSVLSTGEIAKTEAKAEHYSCIGIALDSGTEGDIVRVQTSGKVYNPNYNFTNIGKQVFARTVESGLNISQVSVLNNGIEGEDTFISLGIADTAHSFVINIFAVVEG